MLKSQFLKSYWDRLYPLLVRNPISFILGIVALLILLKGTTTPTAIKNPAPPLPKVMVKDMVAQAYVTHLHLSGHTAEARRVTLRAKTAGRILSIIGTKGQRVDGGQDLIQVDPEDRVHRMAEAQSRLHQRELEFKAGIKLEARSFKAGNDQAATKADFDAAKSLLAKISQELADTHLKAPFSGIFEQNFVEVGDVVAVGDQVATIIDLNPIKIICFAPEKEILRLKVGEDVSVSLGSLGNKKVSAKVTYIAKAADPKTRTYQVEMEADNPDMTIPAGLTARISFPTGQIHGYLLSPASIVLNDVGVIGVKVIEGKKVVFYPIDVIEAIPEGLWVTDLPKSITLITTGGDFVLPGQQVDVYPAEGQKRP